MEVKNGSKTHPFFHRVMPRARYLFQRHNEHIDVDVENKEWALRSIHNGRGMSAWKVSIHWNTSCTKWEKNIRLPQDWTNIEKIIIKTETLIFAQVENIVTLFLYYHLKRKEWKNIRNRCKVFSLFFTKLWLFKNIETCLINFLKTSLRSLEKIFLNYWNIEKFSKHHFKNSESFLK